ncbi:hypothetical protein RUM44_009518 [Polyplax serrata]|uniref:BED-type domain-containing protein n=1 Tax=Polyplax serrata TaxID=468196 RepID=A0ABR1ASZ8_POLSC
MSYLGRRMIEVPVNPALTRRVLFLFPVQMKKCWRQSPIWNFFLVHATFVICKTCGKKLKGVKSTNAESHLACIHSDLFAQFMLERKKWRKEREKRSALFLTKVFMD